jgi:ATP-dependent Clp protease ATP-binding subunit ClpX
MEPEDLIKFGMIPEFVGRFAVTSSLDPLDLDALLQILEGPKNSLVKQFQKIFEMEGTNLQLTAWLHRPSPPEAPLVDTA